MINLLTAALLTIQPTPIKVHVRNNTSIQKIETRDVTFGVKETVEELLSEKGYNPVADTLEGMDVSVTIDSIYSPQRILNVMGLKWLKKDYIVETTVCIGSGCFKGSGERKTYVFAALLDVENNEVPLNRKSFSKALESSLRESVKFKSANK
jgi:hypothetical protein